MDKYIIVQTMIDDEKIMNIIIDTLLEKKLIAGAQVSKIHSKYWWNNYLEESNEFKIQFRTKLSKYKEIEKTIKELHPYNVAEISYYEFDGSKEFKEWIDKFIDNKQV